MTKLEMAIAEFNDTDISLKELCNKYSLDYYKTLKEFKTMNIPIGNERAKLLFSKRADLALKEYLELGSSLTQLSKKYSMSRRRLSDYIKSKGIDVVNKQNIARCDDKVFDNIDTEEKAYWLGFLYADGSVYKTKLELTLKESDYKHIKKFHSFMKSENNISLIYIKKFDKYAYRTQVGSSHLIETLNKKGCYNKKSLTKTFPSYDIVPKNLMRHFLRGYIDGNGYIGVVKLKNKDRARLSIDSNSIFLEGLNNEFGVTGNMKHRGNGSCCEYRVDELNKLLHLAYDECTVYLDRKYELFKKLYY